MHKAASHTGRRWLFRHVDGTRYRRLSAVDLLFLIGKWESSLRALGSDFESGLPGKDRLRLLDVANSMLRLIDQDGHSATPSNAPLLKNGDTRHSWLILNDSM